MSDIRNFFAPKAGGSKAGSSKGQDKPRNRPKPLISSDSDDDDFIKATPEPKAKKVKKTAVKATADEPKAGGNMKAVDAKDFFASAEKAAPSEKKKKAKEKTVSPTENKAVNNHSGGGKKRKSPDVEFHDDADFSALLLDMDADSNDGKVSKDGTPKKKAKTEDKSSKNLSSKLSAKLKKNGEAASSRSDEATKSRSKSESGSSSLKSKRKSAEKDIKDEGGEKSKKKDEKYQPSKASPQKDAKEPSKASPQKDTKEESPRKKGRSEGEKKSPVKPRDQSPAAATKKATKSDGEKAKVKSSDKSSDASEKAVKKSPIKATDSVAVAGGSQEKAPVVKGPLETGQSLLWVDKYKPTSIKSIIGQQGEKSNMNKLVNWLRDWSKYHGGGSGQSKPPPRPPPWGAHNDNGAWAKAALLSGSPGVGKTTTAYLVAKELGLEVTEFNASDTRSKKQLDLVVSDALSTRWVTKATAKKVLLMDEVDGMAGNEDRGGVAQLIHLLKSSKVPVVCMCNDRNHPKIRNLANYCFDLRFQKPRVEQIRSAMMSVCFKEKVKIAPDALNELIVGCNQDVRQVLHQLSMVKAKSAGESDPNKKLTAEDIREESERSQKTSIKMGPWDVCRKVFSATDHATMSLNDKADLFFHDYSLSPLFVQENYLNVVPKAGEKDRKKHMLLLSNASDSLCDGDLIEATIRSRNSWSLLPVQAMFSSVLPGEYMFGFMKSQIQFPNWLGKFSKQNKCDRLLQEVQIHTRLSANLSKQSLNRDFVQTLRDAIVTPLQGSQGNEGVDQSIQVMNHYSLLREDLDSVLELAQWPDKNDPMKSVESKVKAAFTRAYNKHVFLPYSTNVGAAAKKASKANAAAATDDVTGDQDAEEQDDEEDDEDIGKDSMIKAKKKTAPKAAAAASGKAGGSKAAPATAKGKGRGKGKK